MPLTSLMFLPSTGPDDTDSAPVIVAPPAGPHTRRNPHDGSPRAVEEPSPTPGDIHA